MTENLKQLETELHEAQKQREVYVHREERLRQRERYTRSAKDRKRTHRLIQYGVAMESCCRELEILSETEVFLLMEKLLELPGAPELMKKAVESHSSAPKGGEC